MSVNGPRDYVIDGRNDHLIKEKNPESLAKADLRILTDNAKLTRISINALKYSREFSWDKS